VTAPRKGYGANTGASDSQSGRHGRIFDGRRDCLMSNCCAQAMLAFSANVEMRRGRRRGRPCELTTVAFRAIEAIGRNKPATKLDQSQHVGDIAHDDGADFLMWGLEGIERK